MCESRGEPRSYVIGGILRFPLGIDAAAIHAHADRAAMPLRHICEESRVGVEVNLGALPLSPACRAYAASRKLDPMNLALTGGEDYELLFTVSPRLRPRLERTARIRGFPLTCIGEIHPYRFGIQALSPQGQRHRLANTSYTHFT